MNRYLKTIFLGFIIWVIPFVASVFAWNPKTNSPAIDVAWFYALMSFTGAIGFVIAAYYQFRDFKGNSIREGWIVGITWYVELVLLDLIVLVGILGMTMTSYYHLLLTYLTPLILCVAIGYIKRR
jgi:hypothetical protein